MSELLERFDLASGRKPLSTYSGGMRRRLDLAMTLLGDPRLIFLDEPTTGLDPRSRRTMWQIIGELVADGVTIFLTTQYLDEADRLADRIAVLDQGAIVAEGTPAELKRRIPGGHIELQFADRPQCPGRCAARRHPPENGKLALQVPGDGTLASLRACSTSWTTPASEVEGLSIHTPDLTTCSSPSPATPPAHDRRLSRDDPLAYTVTDSATMLRRNLKRQVRYPSVT